MAHYQNSIDNNRIPSQEVLAHLHALPFFVDAVIKDQKVRHNARQEEIKENEFQNHRSGMINDAIMRDDFEEEEYKRGIGRLEMLRGEMLRQQTQVTIELQNFIDERQTAFNQAVLSEEKKATQIKETMDKLQFEKKVAEERRLFDLKLSNERANIQLEQDKQAALNPGFFGGPGGKISATQYATQQQKQIGNLNKGGKGTITSGIKRSQGGAVVSDVKQDVTGEGQKKIKQEGFKEIQKDFTSQQQKLVKEIFFDKKKQKLLKRNGETGEVHELTQEERSFLADTFSKIFSSVFTHYLSALASSKQEQLKMDITSALFGEESKQEQVLKIVNNVLSKVKENNVNTEDMNREIAHIHAIAKGKEEKKKEKKGGDQNQNQNQ